jgi:phosphate transport system permease protein
VSRLAPPAPRAARATRPRRPQRRTSLFAHGEPLVWLTGGALALALVMIVSLLSLVLFRGTITFWPEPLQLFRMHSGEAFLGPVSATEDFIPSERAFDGLSAEQAERVRTALAGRGGLATRQLVRAANYELTQSHSRWISDFEVAERSTPEWAVVLERLEWWRFHGTPRAFELDGEALTSAPAEVWALFEQHHGPVRRRWRERRALELRDTGRVNAVHEAARLALREAELCGDPARIAFEVGQFEAVRARAQVQFEELRARIDALDRENARYQLVLETADGVVQRIGLADIVRGYRPNQLSLLGALRVYLERWWEFLTDPPREANTDGGVFPAIFGTVAMTMIMSALVVPFGVLAALYLREYARQGLLVSAVRIAVNNLAGVPSVVFGVFGLGFFCYVIGVSIDQLLFEARLPNPTFGKGGILWASLTLALLTLPVVIVATEEALSAVPNSMREGSYACGATKWQTIWRIVLPRALPGIMTGMILAIARGAGEVAPLMLVGAVKLAPELPLDGTFPFVHPERSFMHLGFHIFDLGFQSPDSEAAIPMVFTTTLLLIALVVLLNGAAISLRSRLRRRFVTGRA